MSQILRHTRWTTYRNLWFDARAKELVLSYIDPNLDSPTTSSFLQAHDTLFHRMRLEVTKPVLHKIHRVSSSARERGHPDEAVKHSCCAALVLQQNEMNYVEGLMLSTDFRAVADGHVA